MAPARIPLQAYAGHAIDLVEEWSASTGARLWYEVADPATGAVRGRFTSRAEAESFLDTLFPGVPGELGRQPCASAAGARRA
jgi:hypothetical protein